MMHKNIKSRPYHRQRMPIKIIIRRILIIHRIKHQRNIKIALPHYPLTIPDTQQYTRRIGAEILRRTIIHTLVLHTKPVELRLNRKKKKRKDIAPGKKAAAITELTLPDIIIIIRIGPDRRVIKIADDPGIQPSRQRIPNLGIDPDIEIIRSKPQTQTPTHKKVLLAETRPGALISIRIYPARHMLSLNPQPYHSKTDRD